MTFFEPPPPPPKPPPEPPPPRLPAWVGPPENVLPAVVPLDRFAYHSANVLVALYRAEVYGEGCSFHLRVVRRRTDESWQWWQALHQAMSPHGGEAPHAAGDELPDELVRFGVEYADGTKATTLDPSSRVPWRENADPPSPPVLKKKEEGGSGDAAQLEHGKSLWLWPLPPAESFDWVMEWPVLGIPFTRVSLDGAALHDATERVRAFWPEESS